MKYPKTMHIHNSENLQNDDRMLTSYEKLLNVPLVISEKIDGGNTCLNSEGLRARSHNGTPIHPEFERTKVIFGRIRNEIPEGWQIFGENTGAVHAILYDSLPSSFHMFAIRDLNSMQWLGWDSIEEWAQLLDLITVPVLWKGIVSTQEELEKFAHDLSKESSIYGPEREGVVIRVEREFNDEDFPLCVAKFVRRGHIERGNELLGEDSKKHWSQRKMIEQRINNG